MRKIALIVLCLLSTLPALIAQERTKIVEGVYLARYGNTAVIEDDIMQRTWHLSVTAEEKKDESGNKIGEYVYHFACGNKYTKNLTKFALEGVIVASLTSTTMGAGAITTDIATSIALMFYDDVCDYYKDIMQE